MYGAELNEIVADLSQEYNIPYGKVYDVMVLQAGLQVAVKHPLIWLFNTREFESQRYNLARDKLSKMYDSQQKPVKNQENNTSVALHNYQNSQIRE